MIEDVIAACRAAGDWPLPGTGRTLARWRALATLAARDLVTARLVEAHADAVAILAELGSGPPPAGSRWGVWAATVPGHEVGYDAATGTADGAQAWCSGATLATHALVSARGGLLLAIGLGQPGVKPGPATWAWAGMRGADTRTVRFERAAARVVAEGDHYLTRPGFWLGALGVAACWYGGAVGLAGPLRTRVAAGGDPHATAHLGGVALALGAARDALRGAAGQVDAAPRADHEQLARRVRAIVAEAAAEVARRSGRALGPAPYATDPEHAQRVADLEVYVRQEHAERDLTALGALVAAGDPEWSL